MTCCAVDVQQHRFTYDEPMPVESCTQALSDVALSFGEDDNDDKEGKMVRKLSKSPILAQHRALCAQWMLSLQHDRMFASSCNV